MPVDLHYKSFGQGQPVMILHGLFGSSRNWQTIAKKLADSYQVISVDLRNHGLSKKVDSMTYFEMAEDISHLIKLSGLNNVSIIGHSMGGKVAMITSLLYKDIIQNLVVVDIAPVKYSHTYEKLFLAMNSLPLGNIKNRKDAELYLDNKINDTWLTQFLLQNLIRTDQGYQWQINLSAIELNISHINQFPEIGEYNKFDGAALFIGGVNSEFIKSEFHETIYHYFPAAKIKMMENAGHMLHVEQPEETFNSLKSFLDQPEI